MTTNEVAWYTVWSHGVSLCLSVSLEGNSFSHILYISGEYGSSLYMKVIRSRSRTTEAKMVENPYSHNVQLQLAITLFL